LSQRIGIAPRGRAAPSGKEPKTVRHRLNKLYEPGLVAPGDSHAAGRRRVS